MGFLHVGMKVHDIERATRCYTAVFGIAWEPVREYQLSHITLEGDLAPSRTLVTHGKTAQGVEIEMVQVLEGMVADDLVWRPGGGIPHRVHGRQPGHRHRRGDRARAAPRFRVPSELVDFAYFRRRPHGMKHAA